VGDLGTLRSWQRLLDEAFRIPGTRVRFGWDAVVGIVPWAGDVITALMGVVVLVAAHRMRVPGVVQVRMLFNLAIDLAIGLVPFAGDIADVFWKANTRNMALLERHAASPMPATAGDWWFVTGITAVVFSMAALPLLLLYWLLSGVPGPEFKLW
jgi:hypothetical protein